MASVVFAPASRVANTPGTPPVSTILAFWNPASSASWRMYSAPFGVLTPMLAMVGSAIHSRRRSIEPSLSALMAATTLSRLASPCAAPAGAATNANASVAALTKVKYRFKLIAASRFR